MTTWEYYTHIEVNNDVFLPVILKQYGDQGWELATFSETFFDDTYRMILIFKREKTD